MNNIHILLIRINFNFQMGICLSFSVAQEAHSLYIRCRREQIHQRQSLRLIPRLKKHWQIAGETGRLAGDVEDVADAVGQYLRQGLWVDAVAGWV